MKSLDVSFAGINFTIISDNQAVLDLIEQYGFQFGPIHVRQNDTKTWKTSVETQGKLSEIIKEIEKENPVPEYTILSFKDKEMNLLITLDEKIGKYIPPSPWVCAISEARDFLASSNYPVHSVRRNSDNTTWTVGDETQFGKITSFEIAESGNLYAHHNRNIVGYMLSGLKKPVERKPFLVTADGVQIFINDKYWVVEPGFNIYGPVEARRQTADDWRKPETSFSTKEAAEEYVWKNKPTLSYNDVIRFIPNKYYDTILDFVKAK